MSKSSIIGVAKFDGGSMVEIRWNTISEGNITLLGYIKAQTEGKFEVQLLNLLCYVFV